MNASSYLERIPMWSKKKHSLAEVERFLSQMGNPQERFPAVHVAGTNGKGSVCAYLTSILREAGYRTGTFVSPHLEDIRERFLIDGQMVDSEDFERVFQIVFETAGKRQEMGEDHPSYFEFLFYMAMELFAEKQVDIAIIETGLGGRLDATNVLKSPMACVITSIGLDHTQYLGDTIEQIAGEKAGIIKPCVPVIYDASCSEAAEVIRQKAVEQSAPAIPVYPGDYSILDKEGEEGFWIREEKGDCYHVPFEALYQAQNAMAAIKTIEVLEKKGMKISRNSLQQGIARARWPGRMEPAAEGFYLDGAHNPAGASAFVKAVLRLLHKTGKEAFLLFGAMEDKDYREMAEILCGAVDWKEVGLVRCGGERGAGIKALRDAFEPFCRKEPLEFSSVEEALEVMEKRRGKGLVFCTGSLYLIGAFRKSLRKRTSKQCG